MEKNISNKNTLFCIAKGGFPFIFIELFLPIIFFFFEMFFFASLSILVAFFVCWFFRDPERHIETLDENTIVSPADGKIIFADIIDQNPFYNEKCFKISIFMSIFNVHVNRCSCSGIIKKIQYKEGSFLPANKDKASNENEYNAVFIETKSGKKICIVQVAGLIARRIICYINEGVEVDTCQRFGMIRFGSRVDLYLPHDARMEKIFYGKKVLAGKTILGKLK